MAEGAREALWIRQLLEELTGSARRIIMLTDSTAALHMANNGTQSDRTKHIDIRHHFIRDLIKEGILTVEHEQLADFLTKPYTAAAMAEMRKKFFAP